eukprot:gene22154-25108_t
MAATFTAAGATVVAVNYSLAPGVTLDHIVDQNRHALAWVHRHIAQYNGDAAQIYLCGSSAGGHLVGMLLAPGRSSRRKPWPSGEVNWPSLRSMVTPA